MDDGLTETWRGGVAAWECDAFGHLNIAFYIDRFHDAALNLLEARAPDATPPGAFWRSRSIYTRYPKELRVGEGMAVRSAILAAGDGTVLIGHKAVEPGTGAISTIVEQRLAPRAAGQGLPRGLAGSAVAWQAPRFDRLELPAEEGAIRSGRDRVRAAEADENGELSLTGYVQRFSISGLYVLAEIGLTGAYLREARRGFATFETRLELAGAAPPVGAGVFVTSGLIEVGNSSVKMLHTMHETTSGRTVATYYQAGVHFDLEARRSAPIPEQFRARAAAVRIGGG